jgi:hypothetical protein
MTKDLRAEARQRLAALIRRVMTDELVDEAERQELQEIYRQAVLTVADVRLVLSEYMQGLQDEVLADGRVTEDERARCRSVVNQLKIPHGLLSPQIRAILGLPQA